VLQVVGLDTLDFDFDQYEAESGEITIQYVLDGWVVHSLVIEGHEDRLRLEVSGGSTGVGSINLDAGRYILYCDIPGHREGGMEARLLVG
jgi:plastocyanin